MHYFTSLTVQAPHHRLRRFPALQESKTPMNRDTLHPEAILSRVPSRSPGSGLRERVLHLCNGQRTLRDVAREARLPYPLCWCLLRAALRRQRLNILALNRPIHSGEEFWRELHHLITTILGPAGECLLERAALMTRQSPPNLSRQEAHHLLIALELVASEWERHHLISALDGLRRRYAH